MSTPRRPLRPISWWWTVVAAAMVTAAISISLWTLLAQTHGLHGEARAKARLDAIKTALTVGAGIGGAAALLVTLRRQWLSEHEQIHRQTVDAAAEHDATERRITELYIAAANQLGSDTAPIRLAGLYALERLAHDHIAHRQTIVNVMCSYLRMPFSPEPPASTPEAELAELSQHERTSRVALDAVTAASWEQERLVRLTAQQILADHLHAGGGFNSTELLDPAPDDLKFWPDMDLHLSEATLLDFSFSGRVHLADFTKARFIGGANFAHAEFTGHAYFNDARFEGGSGHFYGAWFGLRAVFARTHFKDRQANFKKATFSGMIFLDDAVFSEGVSFEEALARADFNTSWGDSRRWPDGWRERPLAPGELLPRPSMSRWANVPELPPGDPTWNLVVRAPSTEP